MEMCADLPVQYSLFDDALKADKVRSLYEAMDEIARRFGKHTLHLGGSHLIEVAGKGKRGAATVREATAFFGETKRQHLGLPILHAKV
jgi:DNA polymerase-4/DNA polymerase V